ncbi:MAG: phosphate-binding protein [Chloroflexi bacterium HGW-Chloroflexi-2]|jgi:phosphate transport system substrate-binding protein|nr:MAG: phosphate-binding protein [Chloroflexi bacterium HGW-Chloroflexi-2]
MRKVFSYIFIVLFFSILLLSGCQKSNNGNQSADQNVTDYYYLENKGSDTMVNLALYWAEEYQKLHPEVRISVTGGGSGTGISSLINNTVDLANASRQIKLEEIESANKNGVDPIEYVVARDAIAVIVHPDNPINRLTLQEISDIYTGKIENWIQLGGEDRPIVRLSRETNSGTHVYFLEEVIRLGNSEDKTIFSANTLLLPSSEGIIAEVRANRNAIGYDGLGYITEEVKVLGIAREEGLDYIFPSLSTVNDNLYAISRNLYIYAPGTPPTFVKAYLDWIMTSEGQKIVTDLGFIPVK